MVAPGECGHHLINTRGGCVRCTQGRTSLLSETLQYPTYISGRQQRVCKCNICFASQSVMGGADDFDNKQ